MHIGIYTINKPHPGEEGWFSETEYGCTSTPLSHERGWGVIRRE
jgi:hypothetical protein